LSRERLSGGGISYPEQGTPGERIKIKRRCPRTVIDIPLSRGVSAGSQWLPLWLCSADPVRLIVLSSRLLHRLRGIRLFRAERQPVMQPVNNRSTCSLLPGFGSPSGTLPDSPRNGLSSQHLVGDGPATPIELCAFLKKDRYALTKHSIAHSVFFCGIYF
jgi:hypothetical protein